MKTILIAPFSNSDIRDWPIMHFEALIGLVLEDWPAPHDIRVVGTQTQRLRANEIVRRFDPARVGNDCGRLAWAEVIERIRGAACVVGNNSGVAHLAGSFGVPTVCVFGGSHQRLEWRPLGASVCVVSRSIGCSPCQRDHGQTSPFGKACLREIAPETVARAVFAIMRRVRAMKDAGGPTADWSPAPELASKSTAPAARRDRAANHG